MSYFWNISRYIYMKLTLNLDALMSISTAGEFDNILNTFYRNYEKQYFHHLYLSFFCLKLNEPTDKYWPGTTDLRYSSPTANDIT